MRTSPNLRPTKGLPVDADVSARYALGVFHRGDVLRKWREQRRLSQRELAKRARIDKNTVTRAERGDSITTATLEAIVRSLGHTTRELEEHVARLAGPSPAAGSVQAGYSVESEAPKAGVSHSPTTSGPLGADTQLWKGRVSALLVEICLDAADATRRANAAAILEELAVSIATAADPTLGAPTRARVLKARARRRAG